MLDVGGFIRYRSVNDQIYEGKITRQIGQDFQIEFSNFGGTIGNPIMGNYIQSYSIGFVRRNFYRVEPELDYEED